MSEFLAHLVGDYVVQSNYEAQEKVNSWIPAATHAAKYAACFLPLTKNPKALIIIGGSHYVIDRYRLAKYVVWAKNQVAPKSARFPYKDSVNGYHKDTPAWLSTWLMIIADNTIHAAINNWTLKRFSDGSRRV